MDNKILTQITLYNDTLEKLEEIILNIDSSVTDILIIDDGSENGIFDFIETDISLKCVRHDSNIGYGSSFLTGFNYAADNGYSTLISLDSDSSEMAEDIKNLIENIKYGYDIVSLSRVLENFNHITIPVDTLSQIKVISEEISAVTGYDITDPLSLSKAVNIASLKHMEFVESGLGLFIQMFIQASNSGLNMIEIPLSSEGSFKKEKRETESLEDYLMMIETENFLFRKDSIN